MICRTTFSSLLLLSAYTVSGPAGRLVAQEGARVVPGRFIIDAPTLENLGFRWFIEGDSNRNASVTVSYRKNGIGAWNEALPMLRIHNEVVNQAFVPHRVGNLFAGSVLNLQPATKYEVRFVMTDPDGGTPAAKIVTAATRGEPSAWDKGRTLHVFPQGYGGPKPSGAFEGLMAAYDSAQPGDILLLHSGIYRAEPTYELSKSGAPGRPIVLRGGVDGEAILEGQGHGNDLFRIAGADHLMFEDLALRHARYAIYAGAKEGPGVSHLTIRRCRISDTVSGVWGLSDDSENWYIADNIFTGINTTFFPRSKETYMKPGHTGVNVYGRGHVVCHNRISRFSDALAIANFGPPVPDPERHAVSIDFYNNDLSFAQDDAIETDYGCHNIRVYRNRCYNADSGISIQPIYGGPVYLIRNELHGINVITFKWHNFSAGIIAYHNTLTCVGSGFFSDPWQNGHLRNNLILGGRSWTNLRTMRAYALETGTITGYSTLDYNGYRNNGSENLIRWHDGKKSMQYATLADFTRATGYEKHGVMVDYDNFQNAAVPLAGRAYEPGEWDLRLKQNAVAVDAGTRLPNINDGFAGKAPDLGCHEAGAPLPVYGPRHIVSPSSGP